MELILLRHAEAEEPDAMIPDAQRALTERGHRQAKRVARWLKRRVDANWVVLASPALRARQTAEVIGLPVTYREALAIDAGGEEILDAAQWPARAENVIVVGHQPSLGEAAALILTRQPGHVDIRKGALWWFAVEESMGVHQARLKCVIEPRLMRR